MISISSRGRARGRGGTRRAIQAEWERERLEWWGVVGGLVPHTSCQWLVALWGRGLCKLFNWSLRFRGTAALAF